MLSWCALVGTFIIQYPAVSLPQFINSSFLSAIALLLIGLTRVLLTISRTNCKSTGVYYRQDAARVFQDTHVWSDVWSELIRHKGGSLFSF